MGRRRYANSPTNPTTTLGANISIGATTVTLSTDPGSEMPTTGPFSFTVGASPNTKPFNAASRSGTTITLVGTAATAHTAGDPVNTELTETDTTKWIQSGEAEIVNADVSPSAAIDSSKLSGVIDTSATGQTKSGALTVGGLITASAGIALASSQKISAAQGINGGVEFNATNTPRMTGNSTGFQFRVSGTSRVTIDTTNNVMDVLSPLMFRTSSGEGSQPKRVATLGGGYDAGDDIVVLLEDAAGGSFQFAHPDDSVWMRGRRVWVKDNTGDAAANPVTLTSDFSVDTGLETLIDGATSYSLDRDYGCVLLQFDYDLDGAGERHCHILAEF